MKADQGLTELSESSSLLKETQYDDCNRRSSNWWTRCVRRNRVAGFCISSKAAWLTLLWCLGVNTVFGLASTPSKYIFQSLGPVYTFLIYLGNVLSLCFYPLSGYLADNVISRYKMITISMLILIIALLVIAPLMVTSAAMYVLLYDKQDFWAGAALASLIALSVLLYLALNISFIGFNANIIQFGMEQLHDSPADHQSLFIYWFVWIYYLTKLLVVQPWNLLSMDIYIAGNNSIKSEALIVSICFVLVLVLAPFVLIIVSLCVAHYKRAWFLINPSRVSPYKMVYRITSFARQHKVPIRRSAFTYCEDEIPTGLDLAKDKYGGPYTTEEVEDVKAFYGILKILISVGPVFFFTFAIVLGVYWNVQNILTNNDWDNIASRVESLYHYFIDDDFLSFLTVVIQIPLHLFIFNKFKFRCSPNMLTRIGLAMIFLSITLVFIAFSVIGLEMKNHQHCYYYAQYYYFQNYSGDGALCIIQYVLPFVPRVLYGISNVFLYPALYAFICAQSPLSMKGLLIGLSFAIKGIFQAIGAAFAIPFLGYLDCKTCGKQYYKIGILYYGIIIGIAVVTVIIFNYFVRRYKYRQRDEICNVYRYAEEYYSNTQDEENFD